MPQLFTYSDIDKGLKTDPSGNIVIHYDEDAVLENLKTMFSTVSGERVRSRIGSSLVGLLFEAMNADTANDIRRLLIKNVRDFEPRVTDLELDVRPLYDEGVYRVRLSLRVRDIPRRIRYSTSLRSFNNG